MPQQKILCWLKRKTVPALLFAYCVRYGLSSNLHNSLLVFVCLPLCLNFNALNSRNNNRLRYFLKCCRNWVICHDCNLYGSAYTAMCVSLYAYITAEIFPIICPASSQICIIDRESRIHSNIIKRRKPSRDSLFRCSIDLLTY